MLRGRPVRSYPNAGYAFFRLLGYGMSMLEVSQALQSKRAQQIVVRADNSAETEVVAPSLTIERVQAVQHLRDQFDIGSIKVGLRDSTWLVVGTTVIFAMALTWGRPSGLDLFARLLVVAGGVTIVTAVAGRRFLSNEAR